MNVVSRGVRNAFRNVIRSGSITLILGLSIGLSLTMLLAHQAVDNKIASVKSSIGNTITISPAGARGFEGGGEPLTIQQLAEVATTENVSSVIQSLSDRLTTENTSLVSAIDAGTLGNRGAGNSGVGFQAPPAMDRSDMNGSSAGSGQQVSRTFTPPVTITGVDSLSDASVYGGGTVTYSSGEALDPTKDEDVAVVGKALAEKNSLTIGSTFKAYGTDVTVAGIYDTGSVFSNNGLIVPLAALQRLSGQPASVTSATVTVNSIDNVENAVNSIQTVLGEAADVVSQVDSAESAVEPLENIKKISVFSLVGSVVAGATIILLTMVMIVRERRREVGVLKAIGASNTKVVVQFVVEALALTLAGAIIGIVMGFFAAQPITKMLVSSSANSSTQNNTGPGQGGPGGMSRRRGLRSIETNIQDVTAIVDIRTVLYGLGAAMVIAFVGSLVPALLISKVRPAEVMRAE